MRISRHSLPKKILPQKSWKPQDLVSNVYTRLTDIKSLSFNQVELQAQNWHKEHANLRFIVFSDLHANRFYLNEERLKAIVDSINKKKSDFVLMLGDFLFGKSKKMQQSLTPEQISGQLKHIAAPKFAVLGNHDHIIAPERMKKSLESAGVRVLVNESEEIVSHGKKFNIAGIDDTLKGHPNLEKTLADIKPKNPTILLSHNPNIFDNVPQNIDITLAGHTHNLQTKNPILRWLIEKCSKAPIKYHMGEYIDRQKTMYVTKGIGVSSIPIRYNMPPEILELTIKAKNN